MELILGNGKAVHYKLVKDIHLVQLEGKEWGVSATVDGKEMIIYQSSEQQCRVSMVHTGNIIHHEQTRRYAYS